MKRNQYLNCSGLLLELASETKKKSAYIKLAIPNVLAEKMLKQIGSDKDVPINGMVLNWLDQDLPQPVEETCENCELENDKLCPISDLNHPIKYCSEWKIKCKS